MFARVSYLVCTFAVAVHIATAVPTVSGSDCNTGSINCCDSVQSASAPGVQTLAGLFDIALPNVDALLGVHCSPIGAIAFDSNSCNEQPACCTGNQMAGVLTFDCNPINANL